MFEYFNERTFNGLLFKRIPYIFTFLCPFKGKLLTSRQLRKKRSLRIRTHFSTKLPLLINIHLFRRFQLIRCNFLSQFLTKLPTLISQLCCNSNPICSLRNSPRTTTYLYFRNLRPPSDPILNAQIKKEKEKAILCVFQKVSFKIAPTLAER